MPKRTRTSNVIVDPADTPLADMSRLERVMWLQQHGVADERILDALLDPADPELERFANELAAGLNSQELPVG